MRRTVERPGPDEVQCKGVTSLKSDERAWTAVRKGWLTHPSENARYLKYKVEFCTARNFACTLRSLKGLGFQL